MFNLGGTSVITAGAAAGVVVGVVAGTVVGSAGVLYFIGTSLKDGTKKFSGKQYR